MKSWGLVAFPGMPALLLGTASIVWEQAPIVITPGGLQGGWSGGPKSARESYG